MSIQARARFNIEELRRPLTAGGCLKLWGLWLRENDDARPALGFPGVSIEWKLRYGRGGKETGGPSQFTGPERFVEFVSRRADIAMWVDGIISGYPMTTVRACMHRYSHEYSANTIALQIGATEIEVTRALDAVRKAVSKALDAVNSEAFRQAILTA